MYGKSLLRLVFSCIQEIAQGERIPVVQRLSPDLSLLFQKRNKAGELIGTESGSRKEKCCLPVDEIIQIAFVQQETQAFVVAILFAISGISLCVDMDIVLVKGEGRAGIADARGFQMMADFFCPCFCRYIQKDDGKAAVERKQIVDRLLNGTDELRAEQQTYNAHCNLDKPLKFMFG